MAEDVQIWAPIVRHAHLVSERAGHTRSLSGLIQIVWSSLDVSVLKNLLRSDAEGPCHSCVGSSITFGIAFLVALQSLSSARAKVLLIITVQCQLLRCCRIKHSA